MTKICTKCKKEKSLNKFYKSKKGKYGCKSYCKKCGIKYATKINKRKKFNKFVVESLDRNYESFRDKLFQSKFCTKCGEYKSFDNYYYNNKGIYKLTSHCKECIYVYSKKYRKNNKKQIKKRRREHYLKNKKLGKIKKWRTNWEENNPEYSKIYSENYRNIEHNRIANNYRSRLFNALKNNIKSKSTENLIGCSYQELKKHLEDQFEEGMNWDNYGEWHVDHIIPCAAFDLSCEYQQAVCFHYSNCQPLWAEDNLSKKDSIPNFKIKIDLEYINYFNNIINITYG